MPTLAHLSGLIEVEHSLGSHEEELRMLLTPRDNPNAIDLPSANVSDIDAADQGNAPITIRLTTDTGARGLPFIPVY